MQGQFVNSDINVPILLRLIEMRSQLHKFAILENSFAEVVKLSLVKLPPVGKILKDIGLNFIGRIVICDWFERTVIIKFGKAEKPIEEEVMKMNFICRPKWKVINHFVRLTLEIKVNIKINNNTGSETEENEELRLRNYD
ncbi:MAG: hypothetical protein ACTS43_00005 [Candidatus Hodgkinia cicadicola]